MTYHGISLDDKRPAADRIREAIRTFEYHYKCKPARVLVHPDNIVPPVDGVPVVVATGIVATPAWFWCEFPQTQPAQIVPAESNAPLQLSEAQQQVMF